MTDGDECSLRDFEKRSPFTGFVGGCAICDFDPCRRESATMLTFRVIMARPTFCLF
jgi:hypothetical protein